MSLLLDALRRAGAARDGHGTGGPVSGSDPAPDPAGGSDTPASADSARPAGAARARAVFRGGAAHRPVIRTAGWVALGAFAVTGTLAIAGWYYYETSRVAMDRELAGYSPDPEPSSVSPDAVDPAPVAAPDTAPPPMERIVGTAPAVDRADADDGPDDAPVVDAGMAAAATETTTAGADGPGTDANGDPAAEQPADAAPAVGGGSGDDAGGKAAERPSPREAPRRVAATATGPAASNAGPATGPQRAGEQPIVRSTEAGDSPLAVALQSGYRALRRGDLMAARRHYRRALELGPANRDAHLGAAAVAERQGERADAAAHYRRVLEDHPRDPWARSGLAALEGTADPRRSESELKTLLKRDPDAHALRYALGNVYAREGRWGDAQAAYFEAFRSAPDEADYAFNLAVALDRLGQYGSAVKYYERALGLAADGSASFPVESARRRLDRLNR